MIMPLWGKLVAVCFVLITAFGAGWKVKSWQADSETLAIENAKTEMINAYRDAERKSARVLEDKLGELKANEKVIEREKLKIIDRPVYLNNCLDSDGLSLIEQARAGKADTAKPAN